MPIQTIIDYQPKMSDPTDNETQLRITFNTYYKNDVVSFIVWKSSDDNILSEVYLNKEDILHLAKLINNTKTFDL